MTAPVPECMKPAHASERQALLQLFMMGCRELDPCAACAMSAAMYAAAQTAQKGLMMSEEKFLDAAREIYQDVGKQLAGKIVT